MSVNFEALSDLCTPWCIRVAATLDIAKHLEAGHSELQDLAAASKSNPENLNFLLSHLVSKGIFEEPRPGHFVLNEAARPLLDPAAQIGLNLNGIGGRMAYTWGTIPSYVRTGASAYHEAFGMSFWQDLDAHPAIAESFDALIGATGHGVPDAHFDLTIPWASIHTVVDAGGGTGLMLTALLELHPHLKGVLVDFPRTVERAAPMPRLTTAGQSFFEPLPSDADLYLLRGVLNNWPDAAAVQLLKRCAEAAARSKGRVVILKSVRPQSQPRQLSIDMLLTGGKQRSLEEFRPLAEAAGLAVVAAHQQPAYFVVECLPTAAV